MGYTHYLRRTGHFANDSQARYSEALNMMHTFLVESELEIEPMFNESDDIGFCADYGEEFVLPALLEAPGTSHHFKVGIEGNDLDKAVRGCLDILGRLCPDEFEIKHDE